MQPLIVAQQLTHGVKDFLQTAFPSATPGFSGLIERFLDQPENVFKGPYLSVPLPFRAGGVGQKPVFDWLDKRFIPHAHQAKAFARLNGDAAKSTLVATGTGSGKTECFLFPILEHCLQAKLRGQPGIKAIILYPMNALAADQASRLAKMICTTPQLSGIRAGLYVGESPEIESGIVEKLDDDSYSLITNRNVIRDNPPDILLTNYKMLDFLLMRAMDAPLWAQQQPDTLRYLVVDELHTFDGAQGTDLACLIRRLKGRLDTPPGQLVCVGTSATLGDDGLDSLLEFAGDVFGEELNSEAVIREDRVSVGDYLADALVEHMLSPQIGNAEALDPSKYMHANDYLSQQYALWFGTEVTNVQVDNFDWRCELGNQLKCHFAFQNLLRDLDKLGGRSVLVADLVRLLMRRLPQRDDERYALLWLSSLLALVAHARKPGHQDFFLQVKVEIWLRELARMVALLDAEPRLRHHDDLGKAEKGDVYLPVINCRDCHATGWGATLPKTTPNQLQQGLQAFYAAFFAEDVSTRFIFPASEAADPRFFESKKVCSKCGTIHQLAQSVCTHCGHEPLLAVNITANLKEGTRNGATLTKSHHDCPFCAGHKTLSIVGSRAASIASVMVAQLYGSYFNQDKKLIAFSDSVQDAAHRAGFFAARTWRLNLRPALAQTIAAFAAQGKPLTLAELPAAFAEQWQATLGIDHYAANFLPPQLNWLRDVETLMMEGKLPANSNVLREMEDIFPWIIQAEFGQDAHIGRTLVATRTASVSADPERWQQALNWLVPRLGEQIDVLRDTPYESINTFLRGVVVELQRMGAWRDKSLAFYARHGCSPFVYKKNPSRLKLLSGPRPPRFLSIAEFKRCINIEKDKSGIFRSWAFKSLPALNAITLGANALVLEAYRLALQALREAGLADYEDSDESQSKQPVQVWGLNPEAFSLHVGGKCWQCDICASKLISAPDADLDQEPCQRLHCKGHLRTCDISEDFYRKLYMSAEIQRVVAHEHTGLLPRETREWVERDFKSNDHRAGGINLLSATPTLEMGIDIGDLSSTLLCSVPPKQANYLQRAGRAGRSTGNALLMTLAAGKPHDLFFWEEPKEMLTGSVNAPGVFLNASAVLERQLTAYSLDCWVRASGKAAQIPGEIRQVFNAIRNNTSNRFPYPWLNYVEQQRGALLDQFIALFNHGGRTPLSPETKAWLSGFINGGQTEGGSLAWKIIDRLNGIAKDVEEFKRQREKTDKEIKKLKDIPVLGDEDTAELLRLEQERMALSRLVGSIEGKATLNVLTDEGLLPNYSFPEQGVLLRSIILREKKAGSDSGPLDPLTFEYERPGAAAITELAPNNTFYAEGRRVVIDQVDVSKIKPEPWRFCRQCAYSEPIAFGDHHELCPRCGDDQWHDNGRIREMLKLTTVFAKTLDRDSRIADDSDERKRGFYLRQALVDTPPDAVRQAFAIDKPEFPFAFEFLDKVTFREVNFGEKDPNASPMMIAGEEMARPGFAICHECGTLQRKRKAEDQFRNHAPWCSRRKLPQAALQNCVFLYRQFESEGLRIYLPEAAFGGVQERLLSFVAALQLGLTKRFRGAVDHLRIALDMRMAAGEDVPRCYLVIYDSVPGGTGYLKELMRDQQPLFEVLQASLDTLNACSCNQDAEKDGCYRCVYVYQNSHDRKFVSRNIAQRLLTDVLEHQASLKPVAGLSAVGPSNQLFDSELEKRFVEALRRQHAGMRFEVKEVLVKGKPGYQVQAGNRRWRLEVQGRVGDQDGVLIKSDPDFVFWPDDAVSDLPVAVFTDGWRYHKCIIEQDLSKRLAIAKSGKYSVWTLTWSDIDSVLREGVTTAASPWPTLLDSQSASVVGPMLSSLGIEALQAFKSLSPFMQLYQRLSNFRHEQMQRLASALAVGMIMPPGEPACLATTQASPGWKWLDESGVLPSDHAGYRLGARSQGTNLFFLASIGAPQLSALMKDDWGTQQEPLLYCYWNEAQDTPEQELQLRWQQLWQALNLLLPLKHCWPMGQHLTGMEQLRDAPVLQPDAQYNMAWFEIVEHAASAVQLWVAALAQTDLPVPVLGYELLDDKGRVIAEAELAWEEEQVVVTLLQDANADLFVADGWQCLVVTPDSPVEALIKLLRK
jgi:DEAD/DEAH box helicase domain-containing protein